MADTPFEIPSATDEAAHSGDRVKENIAALKALFPEIVTDGKIDFELLRAILGDEVEVGEERYGLNWKGKAAARAFALTPSLGTLRPAREDSVDWETTQNIVIEGDNLEVLKLLRRSYAGQVKLIYIDPPYNTGKDFVYPDNYADNLKNYERLTGQRGADGVALTTNKEASGRFHTDWLNMMYPRLMLAKDLLAEDGFLIISIDDSEVSNLTLVLLSIFSQENLIATLPTIMNLKGNQDEFGFAGTHEYTLVISKSRERARIGHFSVDEESADQWLSDHMGPYKKGATLKRTGTDAARAKRPNGWFPIFIDSQGRAYATMNDTPLDTADLVVWPITDGEEMSWRWSREKVIAESGEIIVVLNDIGSPSLYKKQRPFVGDMPTSKPKTLFYKPEYSSGNGTAQAKSLFGVSPFASAPKPLHLIIDFVKLFSSNATDLVLDFFAGSGTTGHAVMA